MNVDAQIVRSPGERTASREGANRVPAFGLNRRYEIEKTPLCATEFAKLIQEEDVHNPEGTLLSRIAHARTRK